MDRPADEDLQSYVQILDPLLGTNFWSLFWDQIEMALIEGPKYGPIIRDQILFPILGPHSRPWIWGPYLGPLEGP